MSEIKGFWAKNFVATIEDKDFVGSSHKGLRVYVDGVEYPEIFIVNQPYGYIEKYRHDENGRKFIEVVDGEEIVASERIYGNVEVFVPYELEHLGQ